MNKKINTILFVAGATVFNIFVTVLSFAVLLIVYAKLIAGRLPEENLVWGFPVIFIIAVVSSFFAYRSALKLLLKKIEMEKYFSPVFGKK